MSEQEQQQQTSQNEEVAAPVSTQPEASEETPVAPASVDDQVATENKESNEAAAIASEPEVVDKPVTNGEEAAVQQPANESEAVVAEQQAEAEDKVEQSDDKAVSEDKVEPVVANGESVDNQAEEAPVAGEETNGVAKRKAENGAEAVAEDEKSPKKAKVVDDGDQAQVEETAA